jgi:hypothetical protein
MKKEMNVDQPTIDLAKIRWYANAIENEAVQVYFTGEAARVDEAWEILQGTIRALHGIASPAKSCPAGTMRCMDGTCRPFCPEV